MREKLRRFFPVVVSAVLVLCMVAVPFTASAAGVSGVSDEQWFSALTFDSFSYSGHMLYPAFCSWPFPFNSSVAGYGEFYLGDSESQSYAYGFSSLSEIDASFPVITGSLVIPSLSPDVGEPAIITFSGGHQIIQASRIRDYLISFDEQDLAILGGTLSVTYNVIESELGAVDSYVVKSKSFSHSIGANDGCVYLGDSLFTDFHSLGSYIFIEHIELELRFARKSASTTNFMFSIPTDGSVYPNDHISFSNWFLQYDTSINVNPEGGAFDVTDWLAITVGSFLDLEIAPGFSLNSLFYIVLVIAVLLAFIKIIS